MEIIVHRINKIDELLTIAPNFGVEIDIRTNGSELILNHEPFGSGDRFIDYLNEYKHGTLILNIKESGIEKTVLELIKNYSSVKNYFLLDIEFPFLQYASMNKIKNIAIRYSEYESIKTVEKFRGLIDWVWIDTFNKFPLDQESIRVLKNFNTCLVCPDRWQRAQDIPLYRKNLKKLNFTLNAVMTSKNTISEWL